MSDGLSDIAGFTSRTFDFVYNVATEIEGFKDGRACLSLFVVIMTLHGALSFLKDLARFSVGLPLYTRKNLYFSCSGTTLAQALESKDRLVSSSTVSSCATALT